MTSQKALLTSPLDGDDGRLDMCHTAPNHIGLSFGVELEFSLATLLAREEDPDPTDHRKVYDIVGFMGYDIGLPKEPSSDEDAPEGRYILNRFDLHKQTSRSLRDSINKLFEAQRAKAGAYEEIKSHNPSEFWNVKQDETVEAPSEEQNFGLNSKYIWQPMEITSPAYIYSPKALLEVQAVCTHLINNYRCFAGTGVLAKASLTSSVHVHIGFAGEPFQYLNDLKNLMAIWVTFEPQFYSLCASHRYSNVNCPRIQYSSNLCEPKSSKNHQEYLIQALATIMKAKDVAELVNLFSHRTRTADDEGHRMGLNLHNLIPIDGEKPIHTVEFRMHEASLQPEVVLNWLQSCARLMMFSCLVKTEKLLPWLHAQINEIDHISAPELLVALKMDDLATYFERKIEMLKEVTFPLLSYLREIRD